MRELLVTSFLSLDGVMQAPGGPEEDLSDGFALGGWSVSFFDEEGGAEMDRLMTPPFDLLLGRRTYDIFAGYWPHAPEGEGSPAPALNAATKYVASRGNPALTWEKSVLLTGDVVEAIAALKETAGPQLQVHGSGNLVQTLLRAGLVDRWHLVIHPVLVGSGRRLFAEGTMPTALRMVESQITSGGTILATYEPDGPIQLGTMG